MFIKKVIHVFHASGEIYNQSGWEVHCHSPLKMNDYISHYDNLDGTEFLKQYLALPQPLQEEFYKYLVLYYEGGIFADYGSPSLICFTEMNELVDYCEKREICLFQCPTAILTGFVHHRQLFHMITQPFHPLSLIYKDSESMGHKTVVTSLPISKYLRTLHHHDFTGVYIGAIMGGIVGLIYWLRS